MAVNTSETIAECGAWALNLHAIGRCPDDRARLAVTNQLRATVAFGRAIITAPPEGLRTQRDVLLAKFFPQPLVTEIDWDEASQLSVRLGAKVFVAAWEIETSKAVEIALAAQTKFTESLDGIVCGRLKVIKEEFPGGEYTTEGWEKLLASKNCQLVPIRMCVTQNI